MFFCEYLTYLKKKLIVDKKQLLSYIFATLLCSLLFLQPMIIQISLEFLKIRTYNGIDYCSANTYIKIDSDLYQKEIMPLNILSAILIGLVFPFLLILLLTLGKRKQILKTVKFKREAGILFLEYKNQLFLWEIVIIFKKIIIVLLRNYLENYPNLQGKITTFLLGLYLVICLKFQPYKTKVLNNLAIFSVSILALTVGVTSGIKNS